VSLSAVIVDDEQLARDELAYLLKGIGDVDVVAQGKNGLEAVNLIREHNPDLVFLDVQMPGLDGFGVIKKLLDKKLPLPKIVFSTAFDQYAVRAFEVNAVDYLLKPFDRKRVAQSVEKARAKMEPAPSSDRFDTLVRMLESQKPQTSKILLKTAGRLFLVSQRDICYASIEDGIITVVTSGLRKANPIAGRSRSCWTALIPTCSGARIVPISSTSIASRKLCPGSRVPTNSAWTIKSRRRSRSAARKPGD
jgi:DNA-binding LytR/AlgR family response regulator